MGAFLEGDSAGCRLGIRAFGLRCATRLALVVAALGLLIVTPPAAAFEALDGRFQLHGFYEMQLRTISKDFQDDFDLTQWYNVVNLEAELEILQDTWGPIDLINGFIRLEGRFDCIYSRGCGLVSGVNTFGDRAKRLPRRLSDAVELRGAGVIPLPELGTVRFAADPRVPRPISEMPAFRTLFELSRGADTYEGDPSVDDECQARYGPYIPGVQDSVCAYLAGGPNSPIDTVDDPLPPLFGRYEDFRFTAIDWGGSANFGSNYLQVGPWLPKNRVEPIGSMADVPNPLDNATQTGQIQANLFNGSLITRRLEGDLAGNPSYIGNYPVDPSVETGERRVAARNFQAAVQAFGEAAQDVQASGALGFRPIPVAEPSALGTPGVADRTARGIFLPAEPIRDLIGSDTLSYPFNFSELERAFNRGESQQQTGELKELYLDIEMFDARLWLRVGRQNIVWGKTELFSATDQFNPQDFALASLPSLEESRIPLWAFRGVWSFYDVAMFSDVRLELAAIFDEFQGADIGACGEPYTVNLVCGAEFGAFAHGFTGLGVAGVQKPRAPWEGTEGWQFGARLEWRWDRFSFALSDFWGYSKFPFPKRVVTYERNVDPYTALPRVLGSRGRCFTGQEPACLRPGPTDRREFAVDERQFIENGTGGTMPNPNFGTFGPNPDYDAYLALPRYADDPYVPPGTTPDPSDPARLYDPNNALDRHPANQQLFAFVCSATVGVAPATAPAACGPTAFNAQVPPAEDPYTPASLLGNTLAGNNAVLLILFKLGQELRQSGELFEYLDLEALVQLSDDYDPATDPSNSQLRNDLGLGTPDTGCTDATWAISAQNVDNAADGPPNGARVATCGGRGFVYYQQEGDGVDNGIPGLSDLLTPEQEALLGCGPFWGTNCDVTGIDWLNAEGSVMVQSIPGIEGTGLDTDLLWLDWQGNELAKTASWRTDIAQLGRRTNDPMNPIEIVRAVPQPGTERFVGGPVASVAHFNDGDPIAEDYRLPGANNKWIFVPEKQEDGSTPTVRKLNPRWQRDVDGDPDGVRTLTDLTHRGGQPAGVAGHPLTGQPFANEMAALSWNFLVLLALGSEDFKLDNGYVAGECSLLTPQVCSSVRGILTLASARRNDVRAGGNAQFGRRDFQWHGGGAIALNYDKRNVLGFAMDFAEDRSKTNFGIEFSWINNVSMIDNNAFDGITQANELNLTVSMDRPTFVNFLNPNRSFFINSQWFFQYRTDYNSGWTANGPVNVLGTLTILTGYHQDRLNPQITGVYDFMSRSGGLLAQFEYRVTAAFSVAVGLNYFFGRTQFVDTPINGIAPGQNWAFDSNRRYQDPNDQLLSLIRDRDELFMRIRYAF